MLAEICLRARDSATVTAETTVAVAMAESLAAAESPRTLS